MPRMTGLAVAKEIRAQDPITPIIMISVEGRKERVAEAIQNGVSDYLVKPITRSILRLKLGKYLGAGAKKKPSGSCVETSNLDVRTANTDIPSGRESDAKSTPGREEREGVEPGRNALDYSGNSLPKLADVCNRIHEVSTLPHIATSGNPDCERPQHGRRRSQEPCGVRPGFEHARHADRELIGLRVADESQQRAAGNHVLRTCRDSSISRSPRASARSSRRVRTSVRMTAEGCGIIRWRLVSAHGRWPDCRRYLALKMCTSPGCCMISASFSKISTCTSHSRISCSRSGMTKTCPKPSGGIWRSITPYWATT